MALDSEPPPGEAFVPAALRARHAGWAWRPIPAFASNTATTWRLDHADGRGRFLKIARTDRTPSVADEAARTRWAAVQLPVPEVIDAGIDGDRDWMLTTALPGRDATAADLRADPPRLVAALARGLRLFHAAPVSSCPFDFTLDTAIAVVTERHAAGLIDPINDLHSEHADLTVDSAIARLRKLRPPSEDLVVCHGDYCLPNVLIDRWQPVGFVDLGELGVADRWWDLAVATWSVTWNLGPGWEDAFLEEYCVARDPGRIAFYRLLYDLVS